MRRGTRRPRRPVSVTVANATADTTPPTVSVTAPAAGATVSGASVALSASAADNVGVTGVQFRLDATTNIGALDTTSPFGVTWNTTAVQQRHALADRGGA